MTRVPQTYKCGITYKNKKQEGYINSSGVNVISRLNINPALGNISEPDHYKGRMIYATSAVQVAKLLFRKVNVIIFEMFVFQENLY